MKYAFQPLILPRLLTAFQHRVSQITGLSRDRVNCAASDIWTSDDFSFLFRPLYCRDYRFLKHAGVNTFLSLYSIGKLTENQNQISNIIQVLTQLKFYPSYKYPTKSETELGMYNLHQILEVIQASLKDLDDPDKKQVRSVPSQRFQLVYATALSQGELGE
jgi:hypothetical protein